MLRGTTGAECALDYKNGAACRNRETNKIGHQRKIINRVAIYLYKIIHFENQIERPFTFQVGRLHMAI